MATQNTADDDTHEAELALVAELRCERLDYRTIATRTGISRSKVHYLMQENRERWLAVQSTKTDELIAALLEDAINVERIAFRDYRRSQENKTRRKVKVKRPGKDCDKEKTVEHDSEGQVGDPRFLATIQKSQEFRAKLLGLLAPDALSLRMPLAPGATPPPFQIIFENDTRRVIDAVPIEQIEKPADDPATIEVVELPKEPPPLVEFED